MTQSSSYDQDPIHSLWKSRFDGVDFEELKTYTCKKPTRFITATALFDGHDASINIMRRLLQARGCEVIHLGHNRTAKEVVDAAIQEDVHGIALSSYQGGHMEYFSYVRQLLDEAGGCKIKIFGGGGGVISPEEILQLEGQGVSKIYSPEDGQRLGLDGIIGHMIFSTDGEHEDHVADHATKFAALSRALTLLESGKHNFDDLLKSVHDLTINEHRESLILGVTGTGGAGKSSLLDEILLRFLYDFEDIRIGMICVDPSKRKTGGALLGDRIRINACSDPRVFLRSMASRGSGREISKMTGEGVQLLKSFGFDLIIVETSGIGQGDTGILDISDKSLYVMTPEYGAATQLEKIDMLDYADLIAVNKYERRQGEDAYRDIQTVLRRNRFGGIPPKSGKYPLYGTIASRFNDDGTNGLYLALLDLMGSHFSHLTKKETERPVGFISSNRKSIVPNDRENYLSAIAQNIRDYHESSDRQVELIRKIECLEESKKLLKNSNHDLDELIKQMKSEVSQDLENALSLFESQKNNYNSKEFSYSVRGKDVKVSASFSTLSQEHLPRVAIPDFLSKADLSRFLLRENLSGYFPFTQGLFPFRRKGEDPKRQFAGEGGPGRTNSRFHYLSKHDSAKRLSTAFDSVTLYGSNPDQRPDIYGKVGESGVSIAHLDDMKMLYKNFDLCAPSTSVSMTINGPAPVILAMFLNSAIDQEVEKFTKENNRVPNDDEHKNLYDKTMQSVRGTVQADILKEDQAQNTCIFSTEFALKMMGDVQEYFVEKSIRNYYAVSISGYHIAEAGANPISQLAFTLANGFTYVEYYLSRGLKIDDFAPNLSFFFSNGLDAEYSVLGRVARRIWAIALRDRYGANSKSQKLKYHIQTSGRSLHSQEMDFNDIRTTLQALMALSDNCNSLHTNAFDEALTTPTESSVRRAMAIQMIINKEFGLNHCENVQQGSFFIDKLTNLVEEAVLSEFEKISSRGGVLGAMETQYQRSKIQEESLHYEHLKHTGELPIVGVNVFQNPDDNAENQISGGVELIRASYDEKDDQLTRLKNFNDSRADTSERALEKLADVVINEGNVFGELMHTVRHCSLGEITNLLYKVGGKYRRCM